jgi:hypothetical protein
VIPIQDLQEGILFDSRDPFYRYPTGAVPAGTAIGLSLLIPRGECPLSVSVWFSQDGCPAQETELTFTENIRQYQRWTATVTPKETGIYWYTFRVKTPRGEQVYGRDAKNRPVCGRANPAAWQITLERNPDEPTDIAFDNNSMWHILIPVPKGMLTEETVILIDFS